MTEDSKIVEDVERVEIAPAGGENAEKPEGADAPEEKDEDSPPEGGGRQPKEQIVHSQPAKPADKKEGDDEGDDKSPKPVEGETPRERALRQKLETLEGENRRLMGGDLKIGDAPTQPKKDLPPEKADILKRYKPEEIGALREVLPVLAEEMGYVRADQLSAQQYADNAQGELDDFLKSHSEYLPENDKDGLLWGRFGQEFKIYAKPQNPKEYRKIFNRIHVDIFGIKPVGDKGAITAAQKKITVASHAGASGPTRHVISSREKPNTSGIRLDMLKGFSEEEIEEMTG